MYLRVFCFFVIFATASTLNYNMFKARSAFNFSENMSTKLVQSIAAGAQMAMDHCQTAFKWDKWNCPQNTFSRRSKQPPTRETAYTKAIVSAGIVHTITKNCSRGEIKACGCDPNRNGPMPSGPETKIIDIEVTTKPQGRDWTWGGCSDDATYGMELAKNFLDNLEKGLESHIGKHNNLIGRQIVRDTMIKRCRCHGVSGSCSLQTCWMQIAPFETIANKLKEKYNKAIRITEDEIEKVETNSTVNGTMENEVFMPSNNMVYLEPSPDYCLANATLEWPGTKGRTCSRHNLEKASLAEKKSCRNLCRSCGMKVRKNKRKITKRCNCAFHWCCEVKCDTCMESVEEFYCD